MFNKIFAVTAILINRHKKTYCVNLYVVVNKSKELALQQALDERIEPLDNEFSVHSLTAVQIEDETVKQHQLG